MSESLLQACGKVCFSVFLGGVSASLFFLVGPRVILVAALPEILLRAHQVAQSVGRGALGVGERAQPVGREGPLSGTIWSSEQKGAPTNLVWPKIGFRI